MQYEGSFQLRQVPFVEEMKLIIDQNHKFWFDVYFNALSVVKGKISLYNIHIQNGIMQCLLSRAHLGMGGIFVRNSMIQKFMNDFLVDFGLEVNEITQIQGHINRVRMDLKESIFSKKLAEFGLRIEDFTMDATHSDTIGLDITRVAPRILDTLKTKLDDME